MDLGIAGRKAIICASSRGLGKACAMSLARNGVDVTINGRDASVLEKTAAEIRAAAPTVEVSMVVMEMGCDDPFAGSCYFTNRIRFNIGMS